MASKKEEQPFDIVSTYTHLLQSDPDLTMPVAAIEALVHLISHSSASTTSETLSLVDSSTKTLKQAIPNSISLSAGTDLFYRYLIHELRPAAGSAAATGDFEALKRHLISNGRLFVKRAKESREKIARFGRHFVRDDATVLTNGGSRVVGSLLRAAAAERREGSVRFRVIYAGARRESSQTMQQQGAASLRSAEKEGAETVARLRACRIPVATIPDSAVAYSMSLVTAVIVGAEGVVENGGVISRLGTYQMAVLAKAMGKPFYVVAESHKFVRLFPLGQADLGIEQNIVRFESEDDGCEADEEDDGLGVRRTNNGTRIEDEGARAESNGDGSGTTGTAATTTPSRMSEAVDFTPPELISGIITESGVLTPSAVSEELIKIWY